ncbi:hypothetical protein RN001_001015 [Aquatica leii]|uniref:Sulfotransferase domain-containing protein n=1 Tax=Aquatica leii TaxID=1421715 RepID=A0AAN7SKY5_9COLE|nr:hypothetical protein RN001_001015 [Aquatica leii]
MENYVRGKEKNSKRIEGNDAISRIIHKELLDDYCENYIQFGKDDTCLNEIYLNYATSIKNFEIRNDDIIVASYPKAGTTWTQEVVWMIANNVDFHGAQEPLDKRFPHLELCTLFNFKKLENITGSVRPPYVSNSIKYTETLSSPRFIKTHLPFSLLPEQIQNGTKTPKIVYVIRNPKDVCVSYYHHGKLIQGWRTNLENFAEVFLADKAMYGSYWKHVIEFWNKRFCSNVLLICYEDMKKDLLSVIRKITAFLGKTLSEDKIPPLLQHLSFESMKTNQAVNQEDKIQNRIKHNLAKKAGSFIRSGNVKKYKEEMSDLLIKKFDSWIQRNVDESSIKSHSIVSAYLNAATLDEVELLL